MTKIKELEDELDKLEQRYFELNMVDHWDSSDFRYAEKLRSQMCEVRNKLKELKGE